MRTKELWMLIRCGTVSIETDNKEKLNVLDAPEELRMWPTLIGLAASIVPGSNNSCTAL